MYMDIQVSNSTRKIDRVFDLLLDVLQQDYPDVGQQFGFYAKFNADALSFSLTFRLLNLFRRNNIKLKKNGNEYLFRYGHIEIDLHTHELSSLIDFYCELLLPQYGRHKYLKRRVFQNLTVALEKRTAQIHLEDVSWGEK